MQSPVTEEAEQEQDINPMLQISTWPDDATTRPVAILIT